MLMANILEMANVRAKPRATARRLARAAHDKNTVPHGPGAVPLRVGA